MVMDPKDSLKTINVRKKKLLTTVSGIKEMINKSQQPLLSLYYRYQKSPGPGNLGVGVGMEAALPESEKL